MSNSDQIQNQQSDPFETGMTLALLALAPRARSRAELFTHLLSRSIPSEIAEGVLDQLELQGYLNDLDFAGQWRDSRLRQKKMSKRLIAQELKQKGIAADIISEVVADIDDDAEYQLAYALAERKFRASAGLAPEKIYGRLASLLARKGFSSQTISAVYRELTEENGEENLEH